MLTKLLMIAMIFFSYACKEDAKKKTTTTTDTTLTTTDTGLNTFGTDYTTTTDNSSGFITGGLNTSTYDPYNTLGTGTATQYDALGNPITTDYNLGLGTTNLGTTNLGTAGINQLFTSGLQNIQAIQNGALGGISATDYQQIFNQAIDAQNAQLNNAQQITNEYVQSIQQCQSIQNSFNKDQLTNQIIGGILGSTQLAGLSGLLNAGSVNGTSFEQCVAIAENIRNVRLQVLQQFSGLGTSSLGNISTLNTFGNTGTLGTSTFGSNIVQAVSYSKSGCVFNIPSADKATFCSQLVSTLNSNTICQQISEVNTYYQQTCS